MRELAELFSAVADPTRLAILALLMEQGEMCVCDIQAVLELTQSRASRQLKALRLAGLVQDRRVGTWAHYKVPDRPGPPTRAVLRAVAALVATAARPASSKRLALRRSATGAPCPARGAVAARRARAGGRA